MRHRESEFLLNIIQPLFCYSIPLSSSYFHHLMKSDPDEKGSMEKHTPHHQQFIVLLMMLHTVVQACTDVINELVMIRSA